MPTKSHDAPASRIVSADERALNPLTDNFEILDLLRKARLAGIDTDDTDELVKWFRKHGVTFPE